MNYVLVPTNRDLLHSGKGHDDNPPGRGSGRYPYGSGARPMQDKEQRKQEKNVKRYDKQIKDSKKYGSKILTARAKRREVMVNKSLKRQKKVLDKVRDVDPNNKKEWDKRTEMLAKMYDKEGKEYQKLEKFDKETEITKKATDLHTNIIKEYKDAKVSAITNNEFKKTKEYKEIRWKYFNQKYLDFIGTTAYTISAYESDIRNKQHNYTTKSTNIDIK